MYMKMFFHSKYIFILMLVSPESLGETCISFLKHQGEDENDNLLLPERVWRFNSATGIFDKLEYLKPNRSALCSVDFTSDLEGKILNVAVDELNPYLIFLDNNTKVTGFFGDAWTAIQDALKFKSVYEPSYNYALLKTGKYDAHLTASLMKLPPTAYYTHSTVIGKNSYSLFALSEGTFVSKWWYTRIFDFDLWIISTVFVVILTITMMSIQKLKRNWTKQAEYCNESKEFGFPTFNLLCVLGATSGQGFQEMPRSWSLRLCALTALNMGMLLSCGFNSTLTSYLAFRAPYVGMSNLEDVWRLGTYSLCVRNKSLAYDELTGAITTGNKPTASKDKWVKLLNKNCPDMENELELRKSLCRAGFVYVEASDVFLKEYRHVQDRCQIVKIPGTYWSSKISFLHYRGSKYRKTINRYLMRLRSSGILKYLEAKWSFQQDLQHGVFNNFQPVELGHIQILLVGLIIMMIFSVIICIFENLWFSFCNQTRKSISHFPRNEIIDLYNPIHETLIIKQPLTKTKRSRNSINKRTSTEMIKRLSLYGSMKNMNKINKIL